MFEDLTLEAQEEEEEEEKGDDDVTVASFFDVREDVCDVFWRFDSLRTTLESTGRRRSASSAARSSCSGGGGGSSSRESASETLSFAALSFVLITEFY